MSTLPKIDPLKVSQRHNQKLSTELTESAFRETHLELLAESLRDERDTARDERDKALADLEELKQKQSVK